MKTHMPYPTRTIVISAATGVAAFLLANWIFPDTPGALLLDRLAGRPTSNAAVVELPPCTAVDYGTARIADYPDVHAVNVDEPNASPNDTRSTQPSPPPPAPKVQIASTKFSASTDLGTTTVTWNIALKPGSGGNFNIQLFLQNLDQPERYVQVNPGINTVLNLYPDSDNTGSFKVQLPVGHYGAGKAVLFFAGTNYSAALPDITVPSMNIVVSTTKTRVTVPELDLDATGSTLDSKGKEDIMFTVKEPAGTTSVPGGGYWVMVKGSGGFAQMWVDAKAFKPVGEAQDNYLVYDGEISVTPPKPVGLFNLNAGLFDSGWGKLDWLYPGIDYEIGDWVVKADPSRYPSISDAFSKHGGLFAIGGNFGNAIATIHDADNNSPGYFKLLRSKGLTFIRTNYDPDAYLSSKIYREKVDQIVQNQLEARLAPILAPQTMPQGNPTQDPLAQLVAVDTLVARTYRGMPVAIDILNEPHNYSNWSDWKADATTVLRSVKSVNPDAVTIVGFEGYSEDGRAAAADPIDPSLVTYYAMHSYHTSATDLPSRIGGLKNVLLEEWHNSDPAFGQAIASTPFVGEAAWAWTTPGQDTIPLVKSVDGAELTLTDDGAAIDSWQQNWAAGKR